MSGGAGLTGGSNLSKTRLTEHSFGRAKAFGLALVSDAITVTINLRRATGSSTSRSSVAGGVGVPMGRS
jgi:hypothetical protein